MALDLLAREALPDAFYSYLKQPTTWLVPISEAIDLPLDTVNMIVGQIFCGFLAQFFRSVLSRRNGFSSTFRHLFAVSFGVFLISFVFNPLDAFEVLLLPVFVWLLMKLVPNYCHIISLVVSFAVLSYYHVLAMLDRDLTDPQVQLYIDTTYMILIQRTTAIAFSYHDGLVAKKEKGQGREIILKPVLDCNKVDVCPTLLETLSYCYNFFGVQGGPFVFFSHYKDQIDNDDGKISAVPAAGVKILKSTACVASALVIEKSFGSQSRLMNKEFVDQTSVVEKILLGSVYVPLQRLKYYFFWLLAEAISNLAGIGYDAEKKSWDLIEQSRVSMTELAWNPQMQINNWNIGSARWLRYVCFERLPRSAGAMPVFALSAIWHGFWPGQYVYLFSCHFLLNGYKNFRKNMHPRVEKSWPRALVWVYYLLGALAFHILQNSCGICFTILQSWEMTDYYMRSCYYIPFVLILLGAYLPLGRGEKKKESADRVKKRE